MKRITAILLAVCFAVATMASCGNSAASSSASQTPVDYAAVLEKARTEDYNSSFAIIKGSSGEDAVLATNPNNVPEDEAKAMIEMALDFYTMDSNTLCESYALSVSLMNVHSYGVGIFKPAEGQKDAVLEKANEFKESQKASQQNYLPDQYEIASNAIVKELPTGEIMLVMCEDAETVAANIENALK